jgi:glycogen debranching enzyme
MWEEQSGLYYNYDLVRKQRMRERILSSTFHPFKCGIAPPNRRKRLLARLTDPDEFNWGIRPLTTSSKRSADFVEARGVYDGRAWYGNIWALRNQDVVEGLIDIGEDRLAAELNWQTIREFHNNYYEFITPSDGQGQGQKGFAWSASFYAAAIIEVLFGVAIDTIRRRIIIRPYVPESLFGRELSLRGLKLPAGRGFRLDIVVSQSARDGARIEGSLSRALPGYDLSIEVAGERRLHAARSGKFAEIFD